MSEPKPHWCFQSCQDPVVNSITRSVVAAGYPPPEMEVQYTAPLIVNAWWNGYQCPHGNRYWLRPGKEHRERWERENT